MHIALFIRKSVLIAFIFMMTSCLTSCTQKFSAIDCQRVSAFERGQTDAQSGKDAERAYANYQMACNQHNIAADQVAYHRGWAKGRQTLCEPDQIFRLGKAGNPFPGSCYHVKHTAMLNKAYKQGVQVYQRMTLIKTQYDHANAADKAILAHQLRQLEAKTTF